MRGYILKKKNLGFERDPDIATFLGFSTYGWFYALLLGRDDVTNIMKIQSPSFINRQDAMHVRISSSTDILPPTCTRSSTH
jgi:hypothetical protein